MEYQCPRCQIELQWSSDNPHRPFCSARCQNSDFIAWANEENCLPGDSDFADVFSDDIPHTQ